MDVLTKLLSFAILQATCLKLAAKAINNNNVMFAEGQDAAVNEMIANMRQEARNDGVELGESILKRISAQTVLMILHQTEEDFDSIEFLHRHPEIFCSHPDVYPNCKNCPNHHESEDE